MTGSFASANPFEQAEEREQVNGGFKDKQSFALATVAEVKGFVAAFHIKPEAPGCTALVGVAWYSVLVPSYEYGVMVGGFLVNIPGGKEKARHIFINAAGFGKVAFHLSGGIAAGRQPEVRNGRGAWSVRRRCCAFSPVSSSTASVKLLPKTP